MSTLEGYVRPDGRVGLRNHALVLSTVALANRWAELTAAGHEDALLVTGETIRGGRGGDMPAQQELLDALVRHPNTGCALVLTQDPISAETLRNAFAGLGKPVEVLALLDQDGMERAVQRSREALGKLISAGGAKRQPIGLEHLSIALECGGSDPTSALASNAAIGRFVDRVIDAGGTAMISETVEFIGAEEIVSKRTPDPDLRQRILDFIRTREVWHSEDGEDYRGVNPTAENIAGGLTTLVEKSLGAVAKSGTRDFVGALAYGERPSRSGLHFMDTPFFTPISLTGMVQGGCNVVLFGLGQFNPSANPLVPTIKVCGNEKTVANWRDAIDIDASTLLTGAQDLDGLADTIQSTIADCSRGAPCAAERWREGQIFFPRESAPL